MCLQCLLSPYKKRYEIKCQDSTPYKMPVRKIALSSWHEELFPVRSSLKVLKSSCITSIHQKLLVSASITAIITKGKTFTINIMVAVKVRKKIQRAKLYFPYNNLSVKLRAKSVLGVLLNVLSLLLQVGRVSCSPTSFFCSNITKHLIQIKNRFQNFKCRH